MKYRLLADYGSQAFDPVGGVRHGLRAGAIGTKDEEVAAGEQGAHNSEEDCFVLSFADESRTIGADGEIDVTSISRRVSFAATAFDASNPDHLFEAIS